MLRNAQIASLAVLGMGALANADAILSFGFTDLAGNFNLGSTTFTAVGVNAGALHTAGNVNRLQSPNAGTAQYAPGTAAGLANFTLAVSNITPNSATGTGAFTITDANGDTLTANINGTFTLQAGAVFFNGTLANPAFADNGPLDGQFDGPSGGSFPLTFAPAPGPYTGAVVQLFFNPGSFFATNFSNVATQVTGSIIPAPATAGLLIGALAFGRRRRR
jgi:hypothetical protein